MSAAVQVSSTDGACAPVTVRRSDKGNWTCSRTKLHVHHQTMGLVVLSPVSIGQMQSPCTPVFDHPLPPPLDAFVYPAKVILARYDAATDRVGNLTPGELVQLCTELIASAQRSDEVEAVYDVPAVPIDYQKEDDEADEYPSDDEAAECHNSEDELSDEIEEEDDDWDPDEDDARSTA